MADLEPLAQLTQLQSLDCSWTQVADLGPVAQLTRLQSLDCSQTRVADLGPLAQLIRLQSFDCSRTEVAELGPLAQLTRLQSLDCRRTQVADLGPLAQLTRLQSLVCWGTQVDDLGPLAQLTRLQSLDCRRTQVADLGPLAQLTRLQSLVCFDTKVADLGPLAQLTRLQSLYCADGQVADLGPLAQLTRLQSLVCYATKVADLGPLAQLTQLLSLNCFGTQVTDLGPLAQLTRLRSLDFSYTHVANLDPLAQLTQLQTLNCHGTQVADLGPVAQLTRLRSLDFSYTHVANLDPLAQLTQLQTLNCNGTQVADLGPVAQLTKLQTLDCSETLVAELGPLAQLTQLQTLDCHGTQVAELGPLAQLTKLQTLDCSETPVADLGPLAQLTQLQSLACSGTQIAELDPLAELTQLRSLACSNTQVADLRPLVGLPALKRLYIEGCRLTEAFRDVWEKRSLKTVYLTGTHIPGVPTDLFVPAESYERNDHLAAIRAHFRDLDQGASTLTDAKLIVLGNGRAGKTQLVRRLRGEDFQQDSDSTHGIKITSAQLPSANGESSTRLHIWDFGGQDIYHGTHALFVRTHAIFLLLWAKGTENATEYEHHGIRLRNYPLQYWVEYIRHLGDRNGPVLIVQNQCDEPGDEIRRFPIAPKSLDALAYSKELHYSAKTLRGQSALNESLRDAIQWLQNPARSGIATIGSGRLRVQRRLEKMIEYDAAIPDPQARQHRTISQEQFRTICAEEKGVSDPDQLLQYLQNSGIVFYRSGLFDDAIVLDHAWALDAIYSVFNRDKCYRQLKQSRGRFSRWLLDLLIWSKYSADEQKLFLSMMESCGICFIHHGRHGNRALDDDAVEYIAPDLLPGREEVSQELEEKWDAGQSSEKIEFDYALLHAGLIRGVISRIGREAQMNAVYWRDGLCVYETRTRSHALIEQKMSGTWAGRIRVQTQGGQAVQLLQQMVAIVEEENQRLGLQPQKSEQRAKKRRVLPSEPSAPLGKTASEPQPEFGPTPKTKPEWYVSYARSDDTPEGRERDKVVDFLCEAANKAGKKILRDKNEVGFGESIRRFMENIGRGDRVFIVLSDKYLKSSFCTFELFELLRHNRLEPERLRKCTRVYSLPDARIWTHGDRISYGEYWRKQYEDLNAVISQNLKSAGVKAQEDSIRIGHFYLGVADILWTFADTVHPRSIENLEALKRYWFEELHNPDDSDS